MISHLQAWYRLDKHVGEYVNKDNTLNMTHYENSFTFAMKY